MEVLKSLFFILRNSFKLFLIFLAPLVLFFFHLLISAFDAYYRYPPIDIPMHFLGGFTVAISVVLFLKFLRNKGLFSKTKKHNIYIVLISVFNVAIFWEISEAVIDIILCLNCQPSFMDTIGDVVMGMIGCFFVLLFFKNKLN